MKKTSLLNAINLFYKAAQSGPIMSKNEAIKTKIENACTDFVKKLYDKYVNMPDAPQDDIVLNVLTNVKILEPNKESIITTVSGNTQEITKWADKVLKANNRTLLATIKNIITTEKPEIPFDSDAKVEIKY